MVYKVYWMINPFNKFFERKKLRQEKILHAREAYISWLEISNSKGWKIYEEGVNKKIENISKRILEESSLTGEDIKRLQLALSVWREVQRLPRNLEEKAKGGK